MKHLIMEGGEFRFTERVHVYDMITANQIMQGSG